MPTEILHRATSAAGAASWNPATREVEVLFASEYPVPGRDHNGSFREVLTCTPDAVNLERMDAGASLLDGHSDHLMSSRLGTVVRGTTRFSGGHAFCRVRLSKNDLANDIAADLDDGHPLLISVGYRVSEWADDEDENGVRTRTALRWTPIEISAVPVPADPTTSTRGMDRANEEKNMPKAAKSAAKQEPAAPRVRQPARSMNPNAAEICRRHGRSAEFQRLHQHLDDASLNSAVLTDMAEEQELTETRTHGMPHDRETDHVAGISNALARRLDSRVEETDAGRAFQGIGIAEAMQTVLQREGVRDIGYGPSGLRRAVRSMQTTSDFPLILANAANSVLQAAYEEAQSPLSAVFGSRTALNFKELRSLNFGATPDLQKVNEGGEYKRGSINESAETYRVAKQGLILSVSWETLINDNLDAFVDLPTSLAKLAASHDADLYAGRFIVNQMMADGMPLFHAGHGNLMTADNLNVESLSAAFRAMQKQKNDQDRHLALRPKFLVVGTGQETAARRVIALLSPTNTSEANPFAGTLTVLVDPRLDDISDAVWFLACDPNQLRCLAIARLEGEETPMVAAREGWDVDGIEFKTRYVAGACALDWRGLVKNPGL